MKTPASIDANIEAMRRAVAQLRAAGIEILSAEVRPSKAPSIHVVEHAEITRLAGRYTRCIFDGQTHYAAPYAGCEVTWIDPTPVPGALPTVFHPLNAVTERTAHHG